ncbi:hypothetical protein TREMEDRAFT_44401 [Tremella mesenterica DSM 1558]|uniref:uncharacterized protein n=1 Tax=Tremella mesenterica (strain ATCC 24925 / CBS 8224 / DSM 1558 / NBRC 9311 / NRRL Y-6157 / RJB 2259-6 / UBC 559-6) TaxID=578456 RepID=UPI0003F49E8B|nr:uncharacterized protein TREMEDRAFT_44401 [Tremella mesenterica DSM 1558]EIW68535.1 hypothetical protein TREMEDRAFT_44401 [Tremella mesenterica DSM 1558]
MDKKMDLFQPPYPRYSPQNKESFAYTTLIKRWPSILTNIISTLSNETHKLHSSHDVNSEEKLEEGKKMIEKLALLIYEMGHGGELTPLENDHEPNISCYNDELSLWSPLQRKWTHANWLFAECYLYRRIRQVFSLTRHWRSFDPFFYQKEDTYRSSLGAIVHLAQALNSMVERTDLQVGYGSAGSPLEMAFLEMIQSDLWGNATDLSLLVDLKYEDLKQLQAVGAKAQAEQAKLILRNDLPKVWEHLKTLRGARVDVVLDNAGFELYTDLILADFLVSCTPFVNEVVFHPKSIPWFVSDVVPFDFTWAIDILLDESFFSTASPPPTPTELESLAVLATRWKGHLASGAFKLSVPLDTPLGGDTPTGGFWTTQYAYQDMPLVAPKLVEELGKSGLVIFKGDLNYRKLIGDAAWPPTTPFDTALGPLAGTMNLVSLRTNKADTICGLDEGVAEKVEAQDKDWRVSGKYAVISFSPKRIS